MDTISILYECVALVTITVSTVAKETTIVVYNYRNACVAKALTVTIATTTAAVTLVTEAISTVEVITIADRSPISPIVVTKEGATSAIAAILFKRWGIWKNIKQIYHIPLEQLFKFPNGLTPCYDKDNMLNIRLM